MADSAVQTLSKTLKNVDMKIERYKEHPGVAVGTGSGIKYVYILKTFSCPALHGMPYFLHIY